jgi:DNA-binding transcriptional LysR family regulator
LTAFGVTLLGYARSILELSDEMMGRFRRREAGMIRLGLPNDYAATFLPGVLERFHAERHDVDLEVSCGISIELIGALQRGELDIVLAMTDGSGDDDAAKSWSERLVWVSRSDTDVDRGERVPLIAYPHGCVYRQRMLGTLDRADRRTHIAYTTASLEGIVAGVRAGLGITAMSEHTVPAGLVVRHDDAVLPGLPPSRIGLFRNRSAMTGPAMRLTDRLVEAIEAVRPRAEAA